MKASARTKAVRVVGILAALGVLLLGTSWYAQPSTALLLADAWLLCSGIR